LMAMLASFVNQRSLVEYPVGKLVFDPMSYWSRNLIWHYASASIAKNPWLGSGLGQWDRPPWMVSSIDNFWLFTGVTYGVPGLCLITFSVLACVATVGLKQGLDERQSEYRAAYLIVIIGFCLVGLTVAFWDAAYVMFLFLLGSGMWLTEIDSVRDSRGRAGLRASRSGVAVPSHLPVRR